MTEAQRSVAEILAGAGWDGVAPALLLNGRTQTLDLLPGGRSWRVSTGLAGFGNVENSGCTPTGLHRISDCIGAGAESGAVFKGRELTGEVVGIDPESGADYITTRILWLDGLEDGVNRGGELDTRSRYIYIHGTPYEAQLGQPVSAGCVRMANGDILELFDMVGVDTLVLILPDKT